MPSLAYRNFTSSLIGTREQETFSEDKRPIQLVILIQDGQ